MALFPARDFDSVSHREATSHLRIITEGDVQEQIDPLWLTRSLDEGLGAREMSTWATEALEVGSFLGRLEEQASILASAHYRRSGKIEVLVRAGEALLSIQFHTGGRIWVGSAASTQEEAGGALDFIEKLFPERKARDDEPPSIDFSVWTNGSPIPNRHTTEVKPWSDLAENYPAGTRERLAALADPTFEAGRGGKLILLYGPPGTGKSTFLTSLAYEWRAFADLHVISDPANLLADHEYLNRVTFVPRKGERWAVVLLEDSGSLFSNDGQRDAGETRMSALLNQADGLLGKTSKTLWILTTNSPLSSLNEAVSRPGRCAAALELAAFDEAEAKAWFEAQERPDLAADVRGERTLAELYAALEGTEVEAKVRRPVGFQGGA